MGMQALSYLAMELGSYHITQKMTEHGMNKIVTALGFIEKITFQILQS